MIPIGVFLAAILLRLAVIVLPLDLGTGGLISSIFVLQHPAAEPSHMLTTGRGVIPPSYFLEYMLCFRTYGQKMHVLVHVSRSSLTVHQHGLHHPSKESSSAYCSRRWLQAKQSTRPYHSARRCKNAANIGLVAGVWLSASRSCDFTNLMSVAKDGGHMHVTAPPMAQTND